MYSTKTEPRVLTNDIDELQSDVLGELLTDNPLMKFNRTPAKNKQLNTQQQTIISAINELVKTDEETTLYLQSSLDEVYGTLGNIGQDKDLKDKISGHGTVIQILLDMLDNTVNDYEDIIEITEKGQTNFTLTYKPVENHNPKVYVNGMRYLFNKDFVYNKRYNRITWVNEDFELDTTDTLMVEYSYLNDTTDE